MHDAEILDLVDEEDRIIGQIERDAAYAQNKKNIRVVNGFVVNKEGKLWIPRRSSTKRIFPSGLDFSIGGHVDTGESYETAFERETHEELNIELKNTPYKPVGYLTPYKDGVNCFMKVYEIHSDTAPDYNKDDYVSYEWLTPEELLQKLDNGEISKADLPVVIKKLYLK